MKNAMFPVMNSTKWEELRLGMFALKTFSPKWRTRDVESGYLSDWDGEWFYHFREGGYDTIEWLEIQTASPQQEAAVAAILQQIHVPGERNRDGFKVYGYVPQGIPTNYL